MFRPIGRRRLGIPKVSRGGVSTLFVGACLQPILTAIALALALAPQPTAAASNGAIVFPLKDQWGCQNIAVTNPNGGQRQWTWGCHNALPAFSPDGTTVAYTNFD